MPPPPQNPYRPQGPLNPARIAPEPLAPVILRYEERQKLERYREILISTKEWKNPILNLALVGVAAGMLGTVLIIDNSDLTIKDLSVAKNTIQVLLLIIIGLIGLDKVANWLIANIDEQLNNNIPPGLVLPRR